MLMYVCEKACASGKSFLTKDFQSFFTVLRCVCVTLCAVVQLCGKLPKKGFPDLRYHCVISMGKATIFLTC